MHHAQIQGHKVEGGWGIPLLVVSREVVFGAAEVESLRVKEGAG